MSLNPPMDTKIHTGGRAEEPLVAACSQGRAAPLVGARRAKRVAGSYPPRPFARAVPVPLAGTGGEYVGRRARARRHPPSQSRAAPLDSTGRVRSASGRRDLPRRRRTEVPCPRLLNTRAERGRWPRGVSRRRRVKGPHPRLLRARVESKEGARRACARRRQLPEPLVRARENGAPVGSRPPPPAARIAPAPLAGAGE